MADLKELIEQAKARVDGMTPAERAEMHQAQRESFVRGMTTPCDHGVLNFEQCPECRASSSAAADIDTCPVCAEPLNDDDLCATDITMGICHAACLEGSPTVDLETGDQVDGPMDTYRYGDTAPATTKSKGSGE